MTRVKERCRLHHLVVLGVPLLFFTVVAGYYPSDVADERNMTLVDHSYYQHTNNSDVSSVLMPQPQPLSQQDVTVSVIVAAFGRSMNDTTRFNLMLPPTDDTSHLCSLPDSATRDRWIDNIFAYRESIALYVSELGCNAEDKAATVIQIRKTIPSVKFLVIQERDRYNNTFRNSFQATLMESSLTRKFKLGILFVPAEFGVTLETTLSAVQNNSANSPHLLDPNSTDWSFRFRVEGIPNIYGQDDDSTDDDDNDPFSRRPFHPASENYHLLRGFLFGLLIAAPCFRAAFLWYAGGGRFHWRRDEHGRIRGIQHIPPVPYWLAIGRPLSPREVQVRLTEEQFDTLPEIKYQPVDENNRESNDTNAIATDFGAVESVKKCICISTEDFSDLNKQMNSMSTEMQPNFSEPDLVEDDGNIEIHRDECDINAIEAHARMTDLTPKEESIHIPPKREKDIEQQMSPDVSVDDKEVDEQSTGSDDLDNCSVSMVHINSLDATLAPTCVAESASSTTRDDVNESELQPAISASADTSMSDSAQVSQTTRACTTCSICIEDFIPGETLILLPRCHHSYHRECIRPWLLERQGCCPTCKTTALPDETETETDQR